MAPVPSTETLRPLRLLARDPEPVPTAAPDGTWWGCYSGALTRLSPASAAVVEMDARYIVERADPIPLPGHERVSVYPPERVRTGIVVGSVQSGKTASMLGLAALLLDRGVDVLVVLSGTRVALWLQTYARLLAQLDGSNRENAWKRDSVRALVPNPFDVLGNELRADPRRYLRGQRRRVERAFAAGRPVLFVTPKEDDHLLELARFLAKVVPDSALEQRAEPIRMVVLDDEADDASILDADEGRRITPRYIQQLWGDRRRPGETRHGNLLATYIAYTATPQANYLQASHNPLSPRHFHVSLRTPSDSGSLKERSLTFTEPRGIRSYYCGGEMFYERLRGNVGDLCVGVPFPRHEPGESEEEFEQRFDEVRWELLGDALRSYFVAGAIRLILGGRSLRAATETAALSRQELAQVLPAPHSMLYHPSALKEVHFQGAQAIALWSAGWGVDEASELAVDDAAAETHELDCAGLIARLQGEPGRWKAWVNRFEASIAGLASLPGATYGRPAKIKWPDIVTALVTEVFPHTKLRVLNSDVRADDRPSFEPTPSPDDPDLVTAPGDIYTVFVAGNVLSRGLTVEGLCTSLFLRTAREPAADTQMQMQRWFGYRGSHLPYCRLVSFDDQLDLFRAYHATDEAYKQEILAGMERSEAPFRDGVLMLQGERFKATAKVASKRMPLHPGPTPSVRLVETGDLHEKNTELLAELLGDGDWPSVEVPAGSVRGRIRSEPLTLIEVAEVLERLRYGQHDPAPQAETSARWVSEQAKLGLPGALFRPPAGNPAAPVVDPNGCPYAIAAYLRLWDAALGTHGAPGLYPTDAPQMPWRLVDLQAYRRDRPTFYVGVRFGDQGAARDPRLASHGVRAMGRGTTPGKPWLLKTLWGTRGVGGEYFGDQLFDYHFHGTRPVPRLHRGSPWRQRGHPGLVLFHVVRHADGPDAIAVGLALPHGGPDHIAALRQ